MREGLSALLRAWNFEVIAAADPAGALRAAGGAVPSFAIVAAPLGNPEVGVRWVHEVHAGHARLPTILIADRPAAGKAGSGDWLRIDWPVQTSGLRAAIAAIVQADGAEH